MACGTGVKAVNGLMQCEHDAFERARTVADSKLLSSRFAHAALLARSPSALRFDAHLPLMLIIIANFNTRGCGRHPKSWYLRPLVTPLPWHLHI